jgi:hypothetical protein
MRLDKKLRKLIDQNSINMVLSGLLGAISLEKLILGLSNQCVHKANSDVKKRRKTWYRTARLLHRAYDEINLERSRKAVFRIARVDYYECPSCKKRFKVDAFNEKNCKFDLNRGTIVVTCPFCSRSE